MSRLSFSDNIINALMENGFSFSHTLEFVPVTADGRIGYHVFEVDITDAWGLDIENGRITEKESRYLRNTLEEISKNTAALLGDGDGYFVVRYRILDGWNDEAVPTLIHIYNWFTHSLETYDYREEDETEYFRNNLASFLSRTIALLLKRCRCSSYTVDYELIGTDVCTFFINMELTADEEYDEEEIINIIKPIPLNIAEEFRFEIYAEKDGEPVYPDSFVYSFPLSDWDRIGWEEEIV